MPINFRGKEYHTVAERMQKFRNGFPASDGWGVLTQIYDVNTEYIVMNASIISPNGQVVATGWAEEKRSSKGVNSSSPLENCETSAIGRALAALGLDGGGEYCSADELANALAQQKGGGQAKERDNNGETAQDRWIKAIYRLTNNDVAAIAEACYQVSGQENPRRVDDVEQQKQIYSILNGGSE